MPASAYSANHTKPERAMLAIARGTNTAIALGELLSLKPSPTQSMLTHLIKDKLVVRIGSSHDTKFSLTDLGKAEVLRLKARRP